MRLRDYFVAINLLSITTMWLSAMALDSLGLSVALVETAVFLIASVGSTIAVHLLWRPISQLATVGEFRSRVSCNELQTIKNRLDRSVSSTGLRHQLEQSCLEAIRKMSSEPLRDESPSLSDAFRAIFEEHSKLKWETEQLRQTFERVQTQVDGVKDGISTVDLEWKTVGREMDESWEHVDGLDQISDNLRGQDDSVRRALRALRTNTKDFEGSLQVISDYASQVAPLAKQVRDIAFRTKLLAINASVEAVRAGAQGSGFATVAKEIKALADRCALAAEDTSKLLGMTDSTLSKGGKIMVNMVENIEEAQVSLTNISTYTIELSEALNNYRSTTESTSDKVHRGGAQLGSVLQSLEEAVTSAKKATSKARSVQDVARSASSLVDTVGSIEAPPEFTDTYRPSSQILAESFGQDAAGFAFDEDERGYQGF